MAIAAADDKLLFQEAERPKVRRMRYPGEVGEALEGLGASRSGVRMRR
jgi:hypothetical protein